MSSMSPIDWLKQPDVVPITSLKPGQEFESVDGSRYTYRRMGSNNQYVVVDHETGKTDVFACCAKVKPITRIKQ